MEEYMNQVSDDEEDSETIYDSNSSIYSDSDEIEYLSTSEDDEHFSLKNKDENDRKRKFPQETRIVVETKNQQKH